MGFFSSIKNFFGKSEKNEEAKHTHDKINQETVPTGENPVAENANNENLIAPQQEPDDKKGELGQIKARAIQEIATPNNESAVLNIKVDDLSPPQDKNNDPFRYFRPIDETAINTGVIIEEKDNDSLIETAPSKDSGEPQLASFLSEADNALLVRLRAAEPRLSIWLDISLDGVENANDLFWHRLSFLLRSLEAPENEIEAFTSDFKNWLERMEYWHIDEFRSELQYRLALALDLEDEEDERNRLLLKLRKGLAKTRDSLGRQLDNIFASHGELDDNFWNELEELFIMADMGYDTSLAMVERLKESARINKIKESAGMKKLLFEEMKTIFNTPRKIKTVNKPEVILMSGVNGAGKTTTIAKLANRMRMQGKKVLVVAADTFRAAAIEQLQVWADRAGAMFYAKSPGADPAAVAWEGLEMALRENVDVVFIDTAGRLQTRTNLMEELGKIRQVLAKKHPGSPHRSILVLDATTGQNALSQARLFREAAAVDELILTKIDGTAKGGVALAVALQEKLPISFVGLGEKMEDLRPFNGEDFAGALLEDAEKAQ